MMEAWEDDPQARAPMTEAFDTIAALRAENLMLHSENEQYEINSGVQNYTITNLRSEVERLNATIKDNAAYYENLLSATESDLAATVEIIKMFESLPCAIHQDDDVRRHAKIRETARDFLAGLAAARRK